MVTFPQPKIFPVETVKLAEIRTKPATPTINSSRRLPELDGLRGVAILLVVLCHSTFELHPSTRALTWILGVGRLSWSGVDLFFVLSGFLIGGILLDARDSPRYFKTFYLRRAFRILPLYLGVLCLFLLRFLHPSVGALGAFSQTSIPWLAYFTFTQNVWMASTGSFGVGTLAATWSLAVEEQFYLIAPVIVRKLSGKRLVSCLLVVIAAAPLVRATVLFTVRTGSFCDYVLMPCRADALSVGILIAALARHLKWWQFTLHHKSILIKFAMALLLLLAGLTPYGSGMSYVMVTIGYTCLALFYGTLLLIAVTGASRIVTTFLRNPALMKLGTLAYFTYLFHLPFMEASRRLVALAVGSSSELTCFVGGWLGITLTLVCAIVSMEYFERPLLREGRRYKY